MEKFNEKITELNKNPEFQTFMSYEKDYEMCINTDKKIARDEGYNEGIADGINQGIEQGIAQTQIEIAKEMLQNNEDIDKICLYSKLTKEEVLNLK